MDALVSFAFLMWVVVCGTVGYCIGQAKGQTGRGVFWGAFLGPIGWLVAGTLADLRVFCPACRKAVDPDATKCPYCQCSLPSQTKPKEEEITWESTKQISQDLVGPFIELFVELALLTKSIALSLWSAAKFAATAVRQVPGKTNELLWSLTGRDNAIVHHFLLCLMGVSLGISFTLLVLLFLQR